MVTTVLPGVFEQHDPVQNAAPVLFEIPRSGAEYPRSFFSPASLSDIHYGVSSYVETLFDKVTDAGAIWLYARFPNTYIDLNRAETDVDPAMVEGDWPVSETLSAKAKAGRGLLPAAGFKGAPLYDGKVTAEDLKNRVENYYRPYHARVESILAGFKAEAGKAFHLSCHSMPHVISAGPDKGKTRSEIDLGDLNGKTSNPDFINFLAEEFAKLGFETTVNKFFPGDECIARQGKPAEGIHSVQIEVNRSLFMNEQTRILRPDYTEIQDKFLTIAERARDFATA